MNYFTTSLAAVGGLSAGFGVLYTFVGLRRTIDRQRNLLFGCFALAYAGAIFAARSGYLASDAAEYVTANRVTAMFAALAYALLVWFVATYTGVRPRVLISIFTASFVVIGLAAVAFPDLLFDASAGVSTTTLPWGETIFVVEEEDAALLPLVLVAQLGVLIYISSAVILQYRRGERRLAGLLGIGIGWFVATVIVDVLVSIGVIDFVFLSDLGFLGFVVTMSLEAADRTIATERALRELQSGLEQEIIERTAHLEAAQAQLVVKAAEEAAVAERTRLARELHDAVTQLLFSINLVAGSLGRLWRTDPEAAERTTDELRRLTRGALAQMRVLLRELRPRAIVETDLATLVTQLSDGVGARHDIPAEVHAEIGNGLPEDVHLAFYRIAQEAINNVAKHADASRLIVDLTAEGNEVRLVIEDDGIGFVRGEVVPGTMGLGIMQERADAIGAELDVVSTSQTGTSVALTWTSSEEIAAP